MGLGNLIKNLAGKATGGAAKEAVKQNGMVELVKQAGKGLTQKQKYRVTKKILNKGFKQQATRAATVAAVSKNMADAKTAQAKYNYQSYMDALDRYNKVINQNANPAEGTGEPESPNNPQSDVTPVGNS